MNNPSWTDILQTVAIVAALLFTAWEVRSRVRQQRFRNYLDSISGFLDLAGLMIENPELHSLYEYSEQDLTKTYEDMTPAEKSRVHYCDTVIALCETVWYASVEKWVAEDEWKYWKRWARDLHRSPYFRWTLEWVKGEYDEKFLSILEKEKHKSPP